MTLRPIAGLLMMAILAGCQSVDVEPATSSLHIPAQWRATSGPTSPTEQLWWRNFHDSNLNRYVDQALKNNSDVLIARERINEYQARVYAADGSLFPSLDAGVTGTRALAVRRNRPSGIRYVVQRQPDRQLRRGYLGGKPQHLPCRRSVAGGTKGGGRGGRSHGRIVGGLRVRHSPVAG